MPLNPEGFTPGAPALRLFAANDRPVNADGDFVLYWMIATRRPSRNFALDRAVAWARELGRPLIILEALRADYPHASDRLHRFVLDGMRDNQRAFANAPVLYHPYVEPQPAAGKGLLARLGERAAVVVTDEYPCFFLPHAVAAAGRRLTVRLEAVDSNGILPLAAAPRAFTAAVHFRRFFQQVFRQHIVDAPSSRPFAGGLPPPPTLPPDVITRWPAAAPSLLEGNRAALAALPIDHAVPVTSMRGGHAAATKALTDFVQNRLATYHDRHNHPDDGGTSRLSPYLHFGHLSAHDVFDAVMRTERWTLGRAATRASGLREGWWGVGPGANAFLDQLLTWRELAFNTCFKRPDDYFAFESLPAWAQDTLTAHIVDDRPVLYDRDTLERGATYDPLWNAAQHEMRRDGWMHNYMRMLWGKKILEWSETPQQALETMSALMDRWSLDGRDPNSYAGYMWTLGRYDRPWPERPIYGTVRSMSSERAAKKIRVKHYLAGTEGSLFD